MHRVFAEFAEHRLSDGTVVTCRRDTRLYFQPQDRTIRDSGHCVGIIYLQNPGSASSAVRPRLMQGLKRFSWGPVLYPRELLLPQLERVLEATIEKVQTESPRRAAKLRSGGYVQILNLAYVCNASNGAKGLRHWRQLMAEHKLRDDAPTHKGTARFVVCGWGAGKLSAAESQRVAANVVSWTSPAGYLVTPRRGDSSIPIEVDCVRLARLNVTELAHTLRNPNCYPCGGRNRERETFKSLYPAAVSEVLAAILLGENPATVPR